MSRPAGAGLEASIRVRAGTLEVDAEISAGGDRVVALLGPNGAGKTTLLRALAGLAPLEAGRVVLDGRVLEDVTAGVRIPAERRRAGVVFQDVLLFPHLSVLDNVAFGLRSRGMRRHAAREEARVWLDRLGAGEHADRRPRALSGGEAQRVALARALALEPALLLLDEPLAAADAPAREDLRQTLRCHLGAFAGVRLLVTHDPTEAEALADEVVVLEAGRTVQRGSFAEIAASPGSDWVARMTAARGRPSHP